MPDRFFRVSQVRTAVVEAVEALEGWRQSACAPDQFGNDTRHIVHHAFSVAIPRSPPYDDRQRNPDGLLVTSEIVVRWAHQIKADDPNGSYDDACDAEAALVGAVVGVDERPTVVSLDRRSTPEGFLLGTATFRLLHRYAR